MTTLLPPEELPEALPIIHELPYYAADPRTTMGLLLAQAGKTEEALEALYDPERPDASIPDLNQIVSVLAEAGRQAEVLAILPRITNLKLYTELLTSLSPHLTPVQLHHLLPEVRGLPASSYRSFSLRVIVSALAKADQMDVKRIKDDHRRDLCAKEGIAAVRVE